MLARYARWLHTGWPAGTVEKLPRVAEDGTTSVPGVRIVGDLTGVPLLKLAADGGARAIAAILAEPDFARSADPDLLDLAIVGGGVSGIAAALEARRAGLSFRIYESSTPWSTLHAFPRQKPIFTYPTGMTPGGSLTVSATVKEALIDELEAQRARAGIEVTRATVDHLERAGGELRIVFHSDEKRPPARARRAIVAIGRTGNFRRLGCPGEDLDKVGNRLFDPADHRGQRVLVVGGGDAAVEAAHALAQAGADVTLAHRAADLARAKPDSVARLDPRVRRIARATVEKIADGECHLQVDGAPLRLPNDRVFTMIGRAPPLDFFRRSKIAIRGEWRLRDWIGLGCFFLFCLFIYNWKAGTALNQYFQSRQWFPFNIQNSITLRQPGFYYSLAYTLCIALFGWKRIQRRKTPYVTRQTITLLAIQTFPLFLLPYFILPLMGDWGLFNHGIGKIIADHLFPVCNYDYGREYWRAFGLILAWPLFFWNFFTDQPMSWWLIIGSIQTFVLLPLAVRRWGKGAYCGWICSCGALAETMGDAHREKMPHGPLWNRLNMLGQATLAIVTLLFAARIWSWVRPDSAAGAIYRRLFSSHALYDYYHLVDIFLAGVVGVALYFWFSGRVWCRFLCPLAALMHLYARFSRFRIFADKKRCISCHVCTAVCHQGIDVMAFAQRGAPMEDPQCVRCSACVAGCPTGALRFGRLDGERPIFDRLGASRVQLSDGKVHLRMV